MDISADLLRITYREASRSPDPSTQNAAVLCTKDLEPIFATLAHNGFPPGVHSYKQRLIRPQKYRWIEHAERASIFSAAYHGISTKGLTMVCPWAACADCARAIIMAGIKRLIVHKEAYGNGSDRWDESIQTAFTMMTEAEVVIDFFEGELRAAAVLKNGETWTP